MLTTPMKKKLCHRKQKMKSFGDHEEYLTRIAKSLYFVQLPLTNYTSLPVTELAAEIFSQANKFSLNRLDIEKAAQYTRNGCVSPCLLVLALLYLERLKSINPQYLTKVSPTELFLISLLVGSKFLQDDGEGDELNNTDWAEVTGLSVDEVNKAEKEFLKAINWQVFVSQEEFWKRFHSLESKVGLRQGCERGWFTYTELNVLLQVIDLSSVVQCLWNVTSACMLSYTASVLALVGSALLVGQIPGLKLKPKVPMTELEDWNANSTSPGSVSYNQTNIDSDRIQDCTNKSSFVETTLTETGSVREPECISLLSRLGSGNYRFSRGFNSDETVVQANFQNRFYRHLSYISPSSSSAPVSLPVVSPSSPPVSPSSWDFLDLSNLIESKSKSSDSGGNFNLWTWSTYIRDYLTRDSIPRGLHLVASF